MKTAIISFEKYHGRRQGSIGSSMIRAKWLAEAWDEAFLWRNGDYFDSAIFQKVYWKDMFTDFKGAKILDLCDPDWMNGDVNIVEISHMVDAITCSTDELTHFIKTFVKNKPVETVPDRVNFDYFTHQKKHDDKARNVVWFGYYGNAKVVLPQVLPSLKERGLSLTVISNNAFEPSQDFGVEIQNIEWTPETAFADIQASDFAINPPSFLRNFRFKSNNKTLVSWALGLPVANTAEDMDRFMKPEERTKEAEKRMDEVKKDWNIKLSVEQYKKLLCDIQSSRESK